MRDAEFAVVGAGVMGAATAWALATRGAQVVLLEQFEIGHTRGSSHGRSRVFRFSYENPLYVRMAMDSLPLWRKIEAESGRPLLTIHGSLDFDGDLTRNVSALEQCGASFEILGVEEATGRFPMIALPGEDRALFQGDAGIVAADAAVTAFVEAGRRSGVELLERTPVVGIESNDRGATIRTQGETYRVRRAVVTAGAWVRPLLARAGIDVPVVPTRETVAYFGHEDEMSLPILVDRGSPFVYALPDPGHGIKAGAHHTGPPTDPNDEGTVSTEIVDLLAEWVARHYPGAERRPHQTQTCLYTNTANERFILERHGPVVVGSACSGHGFKFAPLIGEKLAELALD
ncbi:MAG TPA: FAD-dependent oxidoreductase [Actinomycetota bacterium]|nr:FAD-dependent oxidoreductase [Actinomycetota bacterium]